MKSFFVAVCISLFAVACFAQKNSSVTYRNPVIAGDFADPSVIRVGNTYYAVGTSSEWGPAYPIYRSKDLVNWQYVGPVFKTLPTWTMGSYWAPELYYRDNTFYVYYTARRKSDQRSYIGVATTTNLNQGFTDKGCLLEWTNEAIDAFVIKDAGKLYITWKAYGLDKGKTIQILGRELTPDGLKVTGEVFTLLQADPTNWEAGGLEGQAIFKRGRYFYMTYSGNACCGPDCNYQVGLARAEKLQGPWEKYARNPVLKSGENWKCPGHGTMVTTPDNRYFYLHHAYSSTDFTLTGRQGVLSELIWDDKTEWPTFKYGTTPPAQAAAPFSNKQQQHLNVASSFDKNESMLPWVWDVSQPAPEFNFSQGYLQMQDSPKSSLTGNFLGLVVKKGTYTFTAELLPQPNVLQSICVYGDSKNALGFGIRNDSLELWQVKDGSRKILQKARLSDSKSPIRLSMTSKNGRYYQFSWKDKDSPLRSMGEGPVEGTFLPRWDRAPRIGLSVKGDGTATGKIKSVSLRYE